MDTHPEPPPEGRLIAAAAKRLDISIREAARQAGLSYGRWRQIVKGYQNVSPGQFAPVRNAPATTVARMAQVVGVTPEQLESEGLRPDAAAVLAALLAEADELTLPGGVPAAAASGPAFDMALRIAGWMIEARKTIADSVAAEIGQRREEGVPEDRIFTDEGERALWASPLMPEADRIMAIAALRAWADQAAPAPPQEEDDPPAELAG